MPEALVSLVPTALVLWLVVFGHDGSRSWPPTREQLGFVIGGSVLLGPLAMALLGFFGWLLLIAAGTLALTLFAALRPTA